MGTIIRQSVKSSISNYIGLVIGYINILYLMPKVFAPAEMGICRFIIDVSVALTGFASLGTGFSISRFFPKFTSRTDNYHHGFSFWVYTVPLAGFTILLLLLLVSGPSLINLLRDGGSNTGEYLYIILPLTLIMLFTLATEQYCAQFGRIVIVNIVRENGLRIMNLILLILVWFKILNFDQFVWCLLISYLLALITDLVYLHTINRISLKPDTGFIARNPYIRREFLVYTGITLIGSLGPMIIARSDYFSVSMTGGDEALGIYAMAFSIAIMTELPKRAILPIMQPVISGLIHENKLGELKEMVRKGNLNQVLIGMAILLALWLNADNIYRLMPNGFKFSGGKNIILILGVGKLIELGSVLPGVIINNAHFFRWNLMVTFSCLVTMFTVYYFAVPVWGIMGTAMGVSAGFFMYAIANYTIVYRYYRLHWMEWHWLKVFGVFLLILLLNHLIPNIQQVWLDIFIRSGSLLILFALLVFSLKLSPELNRTATDIIRGRFRWF